MIPLKKIKEEYKNEIERIINNLKSEQKDLIAELKQTHNNEEKRLLEEINKINLAYNVLNTTYNEVMHKLTRIESDNNVRKIMNEEYVERTHQTK